MSEATSRRIGSAAAFTAHPASDSPHDTLAATVAHFGGILWFPTSLVVYLRHRAAPSRARQESKEALNWQITFTIGYLVLLVVAAIVAGILLLTPLEAIAGLAWIIPFALYAVNVALSVVGGLRVNAGGAYRYPFAIRLIK